MGRIRWKVKQAQTINNTTSSIEFTAMGIDSQKSTPVGSYKNGL